MRKILLLLLCTLVLSCFPVEAKKKARRTRRTRVERTEKLLPMKDAIRWLAVKMAKELKGVAWNYGNDSACFIQASFYGDYKETWFTDPALVKYYSLEIFIHSIKEALLNLESKYDGIKYSVMADKSVIVEVDRHPMYVWYIGRKKTKEEKKDDFGHEYVGIMSLE